MNKITNDEFHDRFTLTNMILQYKKYEFEFIHEQPYSWKPPQS